MIAILWCSLVLGNAVTDGRGLFDGGVFDKDESVDGGSPSRTFWKFKTGTSRVGISRATEATGLPLPMTLIGGLNGCGENKTGNSGFTWEKGYLKSYNKRWNIYNI